MRVADVVEAVNARAFVPYWNLAAKRAASERGLPAAAGSDGHFSFEIGRAYTKMPEFQDSTSFLDAVRHARPVLVRRSAPWLFAAGLGLTCRSLLVGTGQPESTPAGRTAQAGVTATSG